jgi:hypothetical protein
MDKLTKIALQEMGFKVHIKPIAKEMILREFKYSKGTTLEEVYKNCSSAKKQAFDYCKKLAAECDADNFAISGANCMMFSVIFTFTLNGYKFFAHITKAYNHCYEVCDE